MPIATQSHDENPARAKRRDAALNETRLIETARRVLADEPRASMASIATEAGLGRNTIYRHFPSRQDLLDALGRQASDDIASGEDDSLRPAGEVANITPSPLSVTDVLNKVPPFQLGSQIVAEAQRLAGVSSAALYLVDLGGTSMQRLAGAETFPRRLDVPLAIGPEIPREGVAALRSYVEGLLPGTRVAPLYMRGRAVGVLIAIGADDDGLRQLAQEAAAALAVTDLYTDLNARIRRTHPTSPAAEIQQNLLPPRIVRITGALLAGNVLPGYEIGGDWFDYTENPEGAWLGICDADGNGARAAAMSSVVLGAFRAARHLEDATPASAIRLMNATIKEVTDQPSPVTATIATWNAATGLLQWVACGEFPPLLITRDHRIEPMGELQPSLAAPDFPERLRLQSRRLAPGERVLFVSDGILERRTRSGKPFGIDGVTRAVAKAPPTSAAGTLRAIEDAVQQAGEGELDDDATLMVLVPSASPLAP